MGEPVNRGRLVVALVFFAVYQLGLGAATAIGFQRIEEDRADDCSDALDIREESKENAVRNFRALADEFPEVDRERVEHFIKTVERGYDALPMPVTCDDDGYEVESE